VAWAFRGGAAGGRTGRSGDLEVVGRYRGTRGSGEKSGRVTFQPGSASYILH
jgi:hypothetical protein